MVALAFIKKWNYAKATEEDEDKFAEETRDPKLSEDEIKEADLKAALNWFKTSVCPTKLKEWDSPSTNFVHRALIWLTDQANYKGFENYHKEILDIILTLYKSGPNSSHIQLIRYLFPKAGIRYYRKTLKGNDLKNYLKAFHVKLSYQEPSERPNEEDYAEFLSKLLRLSLLDLESEQYEEAVEECAALYSFCDSMRRHETSEYLSGVYEDICLIFSRNCGNKLIEIHQANLPDAEKPGSEEQLKSVEKVLLEENNIEERAERLYDILDKGVSYVRDNPKDYVDRFDGYMKVLTALVKHPDNEATRRIMYAIELVAECCESQRKNKPALFEKYAPVLTDIIKGTKEPGPLGTAISALCEKFLMEASGNSASQLKHWSPLLAALVAVPHAEFIKAALKILEEKKKFLKWKDDKKGVLEIMNSLCNSPIPPEDEEEERPDDEHLRARNVVNAKDDFSEEFMKQLKSYKLLLDPQIQEGLVKFIVTALDSKSKGLLKLANSLFEFIDVKKNKRLALPVITCIEKHFLDEDYPWEEGYASWLALKSFRSVEDSHKDGKDLGPYNDPFLSIFQTCFKREYWNYEDDDFSLFGSILTSTLYVLCAMHSESKTVGTLQPILGDMIKCLTHENEEIAGDICNCFQILSMGDPTMIASWLEKLIDVYLQNKNNNLLTLMSQCYPHNPDPVHKKFTTLLDLLNEVDSTSKYALLDLLRQISENVPECFSQKHVDKLVTGGFIQDQMTSGAVLSMLENIANKFPEKLEKHVDSLMTQMTDIGPMSQIPSILVAITRGNKKLIPKVFKKLMDKMKAAKRNVVVITVMLNSIRILGMEDRKLLEAERKYFVWVRDNIVQLKEVAGHVVDVIDGKTVDNITNKLDQHEGELGKLDVRVTTTETDVKVIGKEVDKQSKNIGQLRQDVDQQETKIEELEEVVDDTVEKVEEIDKKTLSHAPAWSRDVSILLNPESEHDWRLLAQRLGYSPDDIRGWATQHDPCMSLLSEWFATHKTSEATRAILTTLEEMNRLDGEEIVGRALQAVDNIVQDEPPDYETPPPIFISYQWGHQPEVRLLRKHLEMAGFDSWMDIGQMGGGDKLYAKIDEGIRAGKAVICCITEKYAKSPNCNREVNLAVSLGKPIIPLLLENVSWPPPGAMGPIFGEYLYIRFFTSDTKEQSKDERFWPLTSFKELLMQLCYMKLIPEESKVTKAYKNWWLPSEEVIVIPKKKAEHKKVTAKAEIPEKQDESAQPDLFISYQWGIQPQVKLLYKRLTTLGYHCWMDIYQMGGGDSLYDKIDRGVRGCKVVLSCVTDKYSKSANCRREVSLADAIKKPIIPVLLEETTWPPSGPMSMVFTQLLYIQITDLKLQQTWTGSKFNELIDKISNHMPAINSDASTKEKTNASLKAQDSVVTKEPISSISTSSNMKFSKREAAIKTGGKETLNLNDKQQHNEDQLWKQTQVKTNQAASSSTLNGTKNSQEAMSKPNKRKGNVKKKQAVSVKTEEQNTVANTNQKVSKETPSLSSRRNGNGAASNPMLVSKQAENGSKSPPQPSSNASGGKNTSEDIQPSASNPSSTETKPAAKSTPKSAAKSSNPPPAVKKSGTCILL